MNLVWQCDGLSLDLANGPSLQGIALLNIPYSHGGTNLWGDSSVKKRTRQQLSLRKEHDKERELSSSSFNFVDLSVALQGKPIFNCRRISSSFCPVPCELIPDSGRFCRQILAMDWSKWSGWRTASTWDRWRRDCALPVGGWRSVPTSSSVRGSASQCKSMASRGCSRPARYVPSSFSPLKLRSNHFQILYWSVPDSNNSEESSSDADGTSTFAEQGPLQLLEAEMMTDQFLKVLTKTTKFKAKSKKKLINKLR